MQIKNRQQILIVVTLGIVALFAADKILFTPLGKLWSDRSAQITRLRKDVATGKQLVNRERWLREDWSRMKTNALTNNPSLAEQKVFKSLEKWSQESHLSVSSIAPQWKRDSDDYSTLQCRVEATGNMTAVSQFLYDIEKDPMALRLENIEVSSRDNEGLQLALGLQVSALVLTPQIARQ